MASCMGNSPNWYSTSRPAVALERVAQPPNIFNIDVRLRRDAHEQLLTKEHAGYLNALLLPQDSHELGDIELGRGALLRQAVRAHRSAETHGRDGLDADGCKKHAAFF